jgi:hypothetical protein
MSMSMLEIECGELSVSQWAVKCDKWRPISVSMKPPNNAIVMFGE